MDRFGITAATRGITSVYFQSARRTGRTTLMLKSLQDGDRVVFANPQEAARVRRLCREIKLAVECVVVAPKDIPRLLSRERPLGNTVFDHGWIEQYFRESIEAAGNDLAELTAVLSAPEAPLVEPEGAWLEEAKWRG